MTLRTRVLLADDHRLILNGVRRALEGSGEFDVVGEARNVSQVLPLVRRERPEVVVLDVTLDGVDALGCLDQIKLSNPEIKVIVLSAWSEQAVIENALERGASAYIVKSINPVELPAVIRRAIGETVQTAIGLPHGSPAAAAGLSPREVEVLTAVAQGLSNAAIAKRLWIRPQTVKFHLTNIFRKLKVANRTEAARHAYQQGYIESPYERGYDREPVA